ncbi:MAG: DUF1624 domain-containing protein [Oscillospiraceae bacterium]|nr:DUF1624 domain-containing protein [Oscillospiraceae bacterium]
MKRLHELDALRGVMIWCVVAIHLIFDLEYFLGIDVIQNPVLQYCVDRFGFLFVILSGVSVTFGSHNLRRGAQVFGCGMLITAVTAGMYFLGMADRFLIIYFGVLHLLGVCMLLWSVFKHLPTWALAVLAAVFVALGVYLRTVRADFFWLLPFGVTFPGFTSGDYFPLFPHLGWFLLGAFLGRVVYRQKRPLLPERLWENPVGRFFCLCGRRSIWIYLVHQPVLYGIVMLLQNAK